jgi:pyrroloquinoline-quinone synthase
MDRLQALRDVLALFDLNRHPFYEDWRCGRLPVDRLAAYAAAFEPFVANVPQGWEAAGRPDYAADERTHHAMWQRFARALDAPQGWQTPQTRTLTRVANDLFQSAPEAWGALYAFEAQQPATSRVKLDGLRAHYHLDDDAQEYFRVHADDWAEARHLQQRLGEVEDAAFARARSACALLGAALWSGLDGVYYLGK